jgi:hypothetical protein
VNEGLLETAEHALRQGRRGHALDALLEAWRGHRHPALAELITDVGRDAAQDCRRSRDERAQTFRSSGSTSRTSVALSTRPGCWRDFASSFPR